MDRKINFTITDASKQQFNFESVQALYKFSMAESEFWESNRNQIAETQSQQHTYLGRYSNFSTIVQRIDGWKGELEKWSDDEFNFRFEELRQQSLNGIKENNWLWSGNSATGSYLDCHQKYGVNGADTFANLVL